MHHHLCIKAKESKILAAWNKKMKITNMKMKMLLCFGTVHQLKRGIWKEIMGIVNVCFLSHSRQMEPDLEYNFPFVFPRSHVIIYMLSKKKSCVNVQCPLSILHSNKSQCECYCLSCIQYLVLAHIKIWFGGTVEASWPQGCERNCEC